MRKNLKFEFDNEIMSKHFGNSLSLSIKGFSDRFFPNPNNMEVNKKPMATHFNSHLSDGPKKYPETTHTHMLVLDQCLMDKKIVLIEVGNIFDNTDV